MNIKDERCATALFKAHLDVGGVCKLPVCACQNVGSGLWSGDVAMWVHLKH